MNSSLVNRIKSAFFTHEFKIMGAFFIVAWLLLSFYLYHYQIVSQGGDTTFAAQIMQGLRTSYKMHTSFGISIIESIDHIWYRSAQEVCSLPLQTELKDVPWGHFYLIMYPLIPLAKMMDISVLFALLQALVYSSVLAFTYFLGRKKKLGVIASLLLVVLAAQHPNWHQGIVGQFYFNRLFIPFIAIVILLLESKKPRYLCLFLASLLAASTNEIYGITIFLTYASFMWIRGKFNGKLAFQSLLFLAISIGLTLLIQKTLGFKSTQTGVINSTFSGGITGSISTILTNISNDKAIVYFFVNLSMFGVLALLSLRLVPPLGLMLLPNALITIGGAEKIGWSTHYHVGYFLPLIWLGILGISRLNKVPKIQIIIVTALIVFTSMFNPLDLSIRSKPYIVLWDFFHRIEYTISHRDYEIDFREQLRSAVGETSRVSAPEAIVYNLYDHEIFYYPMNIDSVDVVILRVDDSKFGTEKYYSINYGHQDPNLDICIKDRMKRNGFDLDNPTHINGWAVFKKR